MGPVCPDLFRSQTSLGRGVGGGGVFLAKCADSAEPVPSCTSRAGPPDIIRKPRVKEPWRPRLSVGRPPATLEDVGQVGLERGGLDRGVDVTRSSVLEEAPMVCDTKGMEYIPYIVSQIQI